MLLTNIQRFSLHDGPGIRTTVFLKGCSLRCPWCANPENLNPYPEAYTKDGREGIYGKEYTVDEVYIEVMKDKAFYDCDGGVTFSGGEALLQAEKILLLLQKFKEAGITTAVETCLFVPTKNLQLLMPYIDFFYVDMKIMDEEKCKEKIKGNLKLYKTNFEVLSSSKKFTVRVPVIGGFTDDAENRRLVVEEIEKYKDAIEKVELIKEHNLGESKYKSLSLPLPPYVGVSDELMDQYKKEIESVVNIPVEVCKI